ncbi:MFS transporter [Mammaliicoccus stepanovicii]|uniref:Major facilitator family transporter n=1 Tax=Mammaliicoccus stepanovicii TaxID=643214 RepID=A0A239YBU4_9STAP|nr:MFS transporter [Mammaliicoccus stepanovicii]PNZ75540.1 MFS transporter [Mammaliicoccus stepanovicii]GGI42625.1 MFS transporter [Mammaliicoccus stepanovicii]SNV56711.1 major facilitator family transporter [Mammaliicoccus stepanovicii]
MNKMIDKLGLENKQALIGFLSVITAGQLIYSGFEAFKGTFYNLLLEVLNVSNAELGAIFGLIGISVFFYIPGGWINNRFSIRSILIFGLAVRFITMCIIVFFTPSFAVLKVIAVIWGLIDAFFWPAVLNGVIFFTDDKKKALGFGLLESIRRAQEMLMNLLLVGIMALISGIIVFKGGMFVYNLLIIPLILLIIKYVPKNGIAKEDSETTVNISQKEKALDALKGLVYVLLQPRVWLASVSAMSIYWCYIILIYSVPYLQSLYKLSTAQTALFGILNTGLMGVFIGVIAGVISDFVFKSSSKMICVALLFSSITLACVVFFDTGLIMSIILIFAFSVTTFLSKSVILAPIAEFKIPEKYTGSAMSVGSFTAYAPIFWVYTMNGSLLDHYAGHEIDAYNIIFKIGIIVALIGSFAALLLQLLNKKYKSA